MTLKELGLEFLDDEESEHGQPGAEAFREWLDTPAGGQIDVQFGSLESRLDELQGFEVKLRRHLQRSTARLTRVVLIHTEARDASGQADLRAQFEGLADAWQRETARTSVLSAKVLHPAYQRIIGMGPAAVPFVLERLARNPQHWSWALRFMTGDNPAAEAKSVSEANDAWLRWGRERGLI